MAVHPFRAFQKNQDCFPFLFSSAIRPVAMLFNDRSLIHDEEVVELFLFCVIVTRKEPWLSEELWSQMEKFRIPPGALMVN
jgi:hypothetical protein